MPVSYTKKGGDFVKKEKSKSKVEAGKQAAKKSPWIQFCKEARANGLLKGSLPKKGTSEYTKLMKSYEAYKVNGSGIFADIIGAVAGPVINALTGKGSAVVGSKAPKSAFLGKGSLYPMVR